MAKEVMVKRSQDEIVARIKERQADDFLGFETNCYYPYLDFAHAKEFLKLEATEQAWVEGMKKLKSPSDEIKKYMPFAWDKANNCRGISTNLSIEHMIAWLWLDGKDWLRKEYEEHYEYYGKPLLVKICEEYGINWKALDNNHWTNSEDGKGITAKQALKGGKQNGKRG